VRLLIDANLSPKVAVALGKSGFESVHVGDVGLLTASDRSILDYAAPRLFVCSDRGAASEVTGVSPPAPLIATDDPAAAVPAEDRR
jgi:hypothetical protein